MPDRYAHLDDESLGQSAVKKKAAAETAASQGLTGGADETRTRDLRSDSPVC